MWVVGHWSSSDLGYNHSPAVPASRTSEEYRSALTGRYGGTRQAAQAAETGRGIDFLRGASITTEATSTQARTE
jgi:hypothetical protein